MKYAYGVEPSKVSSVAVGMEDLSFDASKVIPLTREAPVRGPACHAGAKKGFSPNP